MATPDTLDAIMTIEGGDAAYEDIISAFQTLVDTGVVWSLQGSYGRAAAAMLQSGELLPADRPSRTDGLPKRPGGRI